VKTYAVTKDGGAPAQGVLARVLRTAQFVPTPRAASLSTHAPGAEQT